ncbi:sigma-70 family RNA polymerase sigma factor [Lentibacillus jeotgali]|uniref:sigma-70 family RNA polymerase sigma factor n=1 Tax=Lentibacillus jeotgali TaxID=558169 RepID=UPI00026287DC|nr:sigma-70 family RNA polymerase sigma factor [Lentibacillus jeotgali]
MDNRITFDEIFEQNRQRINYQIHKLNIRDPHQEFFQEGLVAMWNAYETYQPDKGPMATYFNYMIRNRLIDCIRKETRQTETEHRSNQEQKTQLTTGNYHRHQSETIYPLVNEYHFPLKDPSLWNHLKSRLTDNQWKWVQYHIIEDKPYKDIAKAENTTVDAVKSWGKQVKKKLKDPQFRKTIQWDDTV